MRPPSHRGHPIAAPRYGLATGIGLVVANMVGSGVLTTAGFMADSLGPVWILAAWACGGLIALAGTKVYSALADEIPGSGGEYRYLSKLVHPFAGYLAGWTSLLVGFSAPVAMAALAAGAYLNVLTGLDAKWAGLAIVVVITALHALHARTSAVAQDLLVAVKGVLLVVFLGVGLALGSHQLPQWSHTVHTVTPWSSFFSSLVYIGFCYSGWNAVVYVADEFRHPKRDVGRAMILGTLLVTLLYVAVNWVFVSNLSLADLARVKTEDEKLTLGHVVLNNLMGPGGAAVMSAVVLVALMSSLSAMTLVGPRVYATMAQDGYLPRFLRPRRDAPPLAAVVLQSSVAAALIATQQFSVLLNNAGSILTLTSLLAVTALLSRRGNRLSWGVRLSAAIYVAASAWALWFSFRSAPSSLVWVAVITVLAAIGYRITGGHAVQLRMAPLATSGGVTAAVELPAQAPLPVTVPASVVTAATQPRNATSH
jgi:APA family basic amino acid/polyamine antiporter